MIIENMEKLLVRLQSDRNPVAFEMQSWFRHGDDQLSYLDGIMEVVEDHVCGTAACLAGQAAVLAYQEGAVGGDSNRTLHDIAEEWLGLDSMAAYELFFGDWPGRPSGQPLRSATLKMAITEVTRLIRIGRAG